MKSRSIQIATPFTGVEELSALAGPLERGWLTQGPEVGEFERLFAERHMVPHALATTSCTTALQLALAALEIGPGDEVIVPAFTWVATANVVRLSGATPVFVDVDESTFNLDLAQVAGMLTPSTKAIIPVHLFGLCADVDELESMLPESVVVIEDAACAAGAEMRGRPAGSLGDAAAFSFHPRKIITTGEGGMLTTRSDAVAVRAEMLRNHGASISEEMRHSGPQPYLLPDFDDTGFNFRMTDLQGAVGAVQMGRLDALLAERRRRADWYSEQLSDVGWLQLPSVPRDFAHSWQSYITIVHEDRSPAPRNEIMAKLHAAGIGTRPGTHAVPTLGAYRGTAAACPVAERLQATTMAIPLHNKMDDDDYEFVANALRSL